MKTLAEIQAATEQLSPAEMRELYAYVKASLKARPRGLSPAEVEAWLEKATGVSVSGMTTDEHMAMMRGEE